jgi:hypothetical protein
MISNPKFTPLKQVEQALAKKNLDDFCTDISCSPTLLEQMAQMP